MATYFLDTSAIVKQYILEQEQHGWRVQKRGDYVQAGVMGWIWPSFAI